VFADIDALVGHSLRRVQAAFRRARIGPHHFGGSTGYGHGDMGRAALDQVSSQPPGVPMACTFSDSSGWLMPWSPGCPGIGDRDSTTFGGWTWQLNSCAEC
jgi:hypothetical protein